MAGPGGWGGRDALTLLPRQFLATTAPVFLKGTEVCPVHSLCSQCLIKHEVQGCVEMIYRSVSELYHVPIPVLVP